MCSIPMSCIACAGKIHELHKGTCTKDCICVRTPLTLLKITQLLCSPTLMPLASHMHHTQLDQKMFWNVFSHSFFFTLSNLLNLTHCFCFKRLIKDVAKSADVLLMSHRDPYHSICSRKMERMWCKSPLIEGKVIASKDPRYGQAVEDCKAGNERFEVKMQCQVLMGMQADVYARREVGVSLLYIITYTISSQQHMAATLLTTCTLTYTRTHMHPQYPRLPALGSCFLQSLNHDQRRRTEKWRTMCRLRGGRQMRSTISKTSGQQSESATKPCTTNRCSSLYTRWACT